MHPSHPPTLDILGHVFAISVSKEAHGSAYAYPINGTYFLITADHVVSDINYDTPSTINVHRDGEWHEITAIRLDIRELCDTPGYDLAVLATNMPPYVTEEPIALSPGNVYLGQDLYFLGFPYFNDGINYPIQEIMYKFPLPFLKKAILSAMNMPFIYFDGHNNEGFSGGPIIFWDHTERKHKLLGIVSGYLAHNGEVQNIKTSSRQFYAENSGIGVGMNIGPIVQLLEAIKKGAK